MRDQPAPTYSFGDSELAAERLRRLAAAFEPSTRDFLKVLRERRPRSIADLGCGPGYTTRLLANTFPGAQVCGLDSSENYIAGARQAPIDGVTFEVADVTRALPGGPYDLIYARYLLTHVASFQETVVLWSECLSPGGAIAIEENEWIESDRPAFQQYLSIVQAMLAAGGQKLYVGLELEAIPDWTPLCKSLSELIPVTINGRTAAELFVPNLQNWRNHEFIRRNYRLETIERLEIELQAIAGEGSRSAQIAFGRRRLLLTR
jgi:trans-aconitate 2-methyltransferase